MKRSNRQWKLVRRPQTTPDPSDWELVQTEAPAAGERQVLLKSRYLSVDPYMRARISEHKTYAPSVPIGEVMIGGAVAEVVQSRHPGFAEGDVVERFGFGWQDYTVSDGHDLRRVNPELGPISSGLGVLGMNGLTAYFGLLDVCRARPGETVVVSGAAGATGAVVGQIGRIMGCHVVGTAGSDAKVEWLTSGLGFDGAFNYKTVDDYAAKLSELCPEGVDCYFDNVGGPITDAVLPLLNLRARIAVCGQISLYNDPDFAPVGRRELRYLIAKRARAEGFLIFDYQHRYDEGLARLSQWLYDGKLVNRETIHKGLERAPQAFVEMMRGGNLGKTVVEVER